MFRARGCSQASAFSIEPPSLGLVDWLFSDVICYPTRLLSLVEPWLATGPGAHSALHHQGPGCHGPRGGPALRRHPELTADPPPSQQARADLGQARGVRAL